MLSQLTIQNFGLIDRISIDLDNDLNILTGETGAGKSIIIDALRIVLGDRISSSHIRDQKLPCIIEAVFEIKDKELRSNDLFADILLNEENTLIIHRAFNSNGRKTVKINGFSVTVNQLKEIGDHSIDFHGPHDHQMLLSSEYHMGMLDRLVDFSNNTKFDESTKLIVNYKKLAKIKYVKPTLHRYLSGHTKSQFRRIDADEFTIATLLPVQRFKKGTDKEVWKDSRSMI